jgi:hypothetical protein
MGSHRSRAVAGHTGFDSAEMARGKEIGEEEPAAYTAYQFLGMFNLRQELRKKSLEVHSAVVLLRWRSGPQSSPKESRMVRLSKHQCLTSIYADGLISQKLICGIKKINAAKVETSIGENATLGTP